MNEDECEILKNVGIKVLIRKDFPLVCETLERIGIINHKEKKIWPSAYIFKTGETLSDLLDNKEDYSKEELEEEIYTIAHFKELFKLQDKPSTFDETDQIRLKTIVYFVQKWRLIEVVFDDEVQEILQNKIGVLPYKDKRKYRVIHKFRYNRE